MKVVVRKYKLYTLLALLILNISLSCAQQKPRDRIKHKNGMKDKISKPKQVPKTIYSMNLIDLKQNENGLHCFMTDSLEYSIIDGKTTIYSEYQTTGTDNPAFIPYLYAEGEFLEGKYQGIWKFYDKNKKLIKKEKWDKGNLIYRKEYNN